MKAMLGWISSALTRPPEPEAAPPGVGQTGLLGSVRIAGKAGWYAVSDVRPDDPVLTFDAGVQPVREVWSEPVWHGGSHCPDALWPVEIPRGALGNLGMLCVAPDQRILVESDVAEDMTGGPFVLLPARSLVGVRGICRVPPPPEERVTTLVFDREQVIFAERGIMLHCPATAGDLIGTGAAATDAREPMTQAQIAQIAASLDGPPLQAG